MKICPVPSCDRAVKTHGWCQKHYYRWATYGDPLVTRYNMDGEQIACRVTGCTTKVVHTARKPNRPEWAKDPMCPKHYRRAQRGEPLVRDRERGDGADKDGYVYLVRRNHPAARKSGYVAEHRLVMEAELGRYLLPEETVHHKNGIRDDNRPGNLELWTKSHPPGQRAIDKLAWARRIVALYEASEAELA